MTTRRGALETAAASVGAHLSSSLNGGVLGATPFAYRTGTAPSETLLRVGVGAGGMAGADINSLTASKHVYTQKPLTQTVHEARQLSLAAAKAGAVTRTGIQIHSAAEHYAVWVTRDELCTAGLLSPTVGLTPDAITE